MKNYGTVTTVPISYNVLYFQFKKVHALQEAFPLEEDDTPISNQDTARLYVEARVGKVALGWNKRERRLKVNVSGA